MKKSILAGILAVSCAFTCAFGLAACDDKDKKDPVNPPPVVTDPEPGEIKNPVTLTIGTAANYSASATKYYYKVTATTAGYYRLTFTGDNADEVKVECGTLNSAGDGFAAGKQSATVISGHATVELVAGVNYIALYTEETGAHTGTFTLAVVNNTPTEGPDLTTAAPVTVSVTPGTPGVECEIKGEAGKSYSITAKIGGEVATDVLLFVSAGCYGNGAIAEYEFQSGSTVTVTYNPQSSTAAANVELTLTELQEKTYTQITVGTEVTGTQLVINNWACTYSIKFTEKGLYKVSGAISLSDIVIGGTLFEDEVDPNEANSLPVNTTSGLFVVTDTETTYYVTVYSTENFTISKDTQAISTTNPLTVDLKSGVNFYLPVSGTADQWYKISATVGGSPIDVKLIAGPAVSGEAELTFQYSEGFEIFVANPFTDVGSVQDISNLVLTLTETTEPEEEDNIPAMTLGTPVSGGAIGKVYSINLEAGKTYVLTVSGQDDSGPNSTLFNVMIGMNLDPDAPADSPVVVDDETALQFDISASTDEVTVETGGTYYVSLFAGDTFTITEKAQ